MMALLTWLGAEKCALRAFLLEEWRARIGKSVPVALSI